MPSGRRVTYLNNDIMYTWDNVSEIKYQNWLKMTSPEMREDFTVNGFPVFVQIESTNHCNLECPICPAGGLGFKRGKRHMNLGEFKAIIDDVKDYLLFIVLWDWGEPLLNPDLPDMVRYAAEHDIKTVASTNCNCNFFHDESYMERLLKSGLSTLIVAVDSVQQDSYALYRKKGNLTRALEGIKKTVALKNKLGSQTLLMLRMVAMRQNEHEMRSLRRMARELGVDRFSVKTMNPWSESHDKDMAPMNPAYRRFHYKKGTWERIRLPFDCDYILQKCTIHSNGDVVPCCWHYDNDISTGNVFTDGGLTKIWNSPSYRALRKRILLEKDTIPICTTCSLNYKLSKTGWFLQTLDLTRSRKDQYRYLLKRYIELNMNPDLLTTLIRTRDKIKSSFGF